MALPTTAPRYMSRFQCIADRCEDTCCSGLAVGVSKADWQRLQEVVAKDPEAQPLRELFQQGTPGGDYILPKRSDGCCTFLDSRKMCSLHARHGDAILPDVCVTFPRVTLRWGPQLEMAGTLACPEVARLVLLAEDAMEPVPLPAERVFRPEAARDPSQEHAGEAWGTHAAEVRATVVRLLSRNELPIAARLLLLGRLAVQLTPFYFQGTKAFQGDGRAAAEGHLAAVLQAADAPEALEAARRDMAPQPLPGGFFAETYTSALKSRLKNYPVPRFHAFVQDVVNAYGGPEATPDAAWQLYTQRREQLERTHGARMRQYFSHTALNHWLRGPFIDAPRVIDDVFRLVLVGGLQRWALMGHPEVARLCEQEATLATDEARERLDRAAVEAFQLITRHMERSPDLLGLGMGLAGQGGPEALMPLLMMLKGYGDPLPLA